MLRWESRRAGKRNRKHSHESSENWLLPRSQPVQDLVGRGAQETFLKLMKSKLRSGTCRIRHLRKERKAGSITGKTGGCSAISTLQTLSSATFLAPAPHPTVTSESPQAECSMHILN